MKSIEQLKKKDLNCNIFSVYDYDGLTITELLCQFFTKINECIDISNETIDLATWLVNEGLEIEVAKKLVLWLEDGTLENIINNTIFNKLSNKINDICVNVKDFGAIGDGVNDDREAIQSALTHLEQQGGGTLFFPKSNGYYRINSYTIIDSKKVGLILKSNNIRIIGDSQNVEIKTDTRLDALLYTPIRIDNLAIENITINSNNVSDYCFYTKTYTPYLKIDNVTFTKAIETNVYLKTYVSLLNKVRFLWGKIGLHLLGDTNGITTSVTLNSCYANTNSEIGYKFNDVVYSTMNSCACDNTKIGYDLSVRGFSLNGCGCEATQKPIRFTAFRGVTINGFYIYNCGGKDEDNKTKYLVEYVSGKNATISGLMFENIYNYEYKLGLTSSNYGFENITIVDDSLTKDESYYVTNYKFNNPIKFLRDETTKDISISCSLNDLSTEFKKLPTEINHTVTITINEGTLENYPVLENKKGSGKIIIDLNGYDIKPRNPSSYGLRFKNVGVNVFVKNGTISQTATHNYGEVVRVENSKLISLNNLALNNVSGNKGGACVGAWNGSIVVVNNCTYSGMFESDGIFTKLNNDGTSILNGNI